jgi:hypothetical protein
MKKMITPAFVAALALLILDAASVIGGRGRGGGAAGRGGGVGGGRPVGTGGTVNSFGGAGAGSRTVSPIVGPAGGSGQAARGGGSYTTAGGTNVTYKGAGVGGTTAGGIQGGRAVGGVQVTTPGGREVTKVGTGGVAVGPGGNAVGGRAGVTVGSGPQGSIATRYQGGAAVGPAGGVAGGSRVGVATGPGGAVVGGSRSTVASGPYGAVAGRSTVVAGRGTYYRSAAVIGGQGVYVRQAVAHYPCFRPGWYAQYPGAWFAAGWAASAVWRAATWGTCASYCGYPSEPVYYNYGENVVYQDDGVYIDGQKAANTDQFDQQADVLADAGRQAKAAKEGEWLSLGVFAMVQGEAKTSNHIFQLAVNKQGVIRGNYYDAVTDSTAPVFGAVDQKTQRAAWTVGDRKTPVYEAGIANLTQNETTMLAHYGKDRTEQYSFIRIEEPENN